MNPAEALQILDLATDPRRAGMMTRVDYSRCEMALSVLEKLVKDSKPPTPEAPAPHGQ